MRPGSNKFTLDRKVDRNKIHFMIDFVCPPSLRSKRKREGEGEWGGGRRKMEEGETLPFFSSLLLPFPFPFALATQAMSA